MCLCWSVSRSAYSESQNKLQGAQKLLFFTSFFYFVCNFVQNIATWLPIHFGRNVQSKNCYPPIISPFLCHALLYPSWKLSITEKINNKYKEFYLVLVEFLRQKLYALHARGRKSNWPLFTNDNGNNTKDIETWHKNAALWQVA